MKVEFNLTKEDVWKCHYYFWRQNPLIFLQRFFVPVTIVLCCIPLVIKGIATVILTSLAGAVLILLVLLSFLSQRYQAWKSIRTQPEILGERVAEIGKFDFRYGGPASVGYYYHWSYFVDLAEVGDYFYFSLKTKVLIVPTSSFSSAGDACDFFDQAQACWQAAIAAPSYASLPEQGVWPPPPRIER